MLRAARFEAKLGFQLDEASLAPIAELRKLMVEVPPARLFDEINKLFLTGHGAASLPVLRKHGLLEVILPGVETFMRRHPGSPVEQLLLQGLANTDARVQNDRPVTPVFLYALLLYGPIAGYIETLPREHWSDPQAILDGCDRALREAHRRVTIPRRIALGVREMFALQPRLEQPRGKRAIRLLELPRFRAAYDLLLLRARVGLASADVARWWTDLQSASPEMRDAMANSLPSARGGARGAADDDSLLGGAEPEGEGTASPPRRRRRGGRNRRRAGGAGGGAKAD
jgi:poly(A) polymerase